MFGHVIRCPAAVEPEPPRPGPDSHITPNTSQTPRSPADRHKQRDPTASAPHPAAQKTAYQVIPGGGGLLSFQIKFRGYG